MDMLGRMLVLSVMAGLLAFFVPGSVDPVLASGQSGEIKLSMLAPRESSLYTNFKKLGDKIEKATQGAWKLRVYPFGVAGDEKDVIRKMNVGQMDGGVITTTGLSVIEPQVAILDTPSLIADYKDAEAIQKVMEQEIPPLLQKKNVKVLTSWEAGQYRLFYDDRKGTIWVPTDMKKHRAWVWPENYILKELYRESGATGVPLSVTDVFGALQTGMIDMMFNSPYATVQMRWHSKMNRVSERAQGVLLFFWVMNQSKWDAIPENVQKLMTEDLPAMRQQARVDARTSDDAAYNGLLKRGYKPNIVSSTQNTEWTKLFDKVAQKLTGRLWTEALYKKLMAAKNGK
jgi:TRAP-type transport system periplasmic protein